MKLKFLFILFTLTILFGCKNSSSEKLKGIVTKFLKEKVKNPSSYNPLHFSSIDTMHDEIYRDSFMMKYKPDYKYSVEHIYEIENSDKQKIKMSVSFHFDSTLKIIGTSPEGLNGDYGQLTGNVYWKYNNFVGNKPDAGSEASLYSLDTLRKDLKYEATCDVMGNFKFDKVLPGYYLLIVKSRNTTNSPDGHLNRLLLYSSYLSRLFGYDIYKENKNQIQEYKVLDSLYNKALMADEKEYGSFSKRYDAYRKLEKQKMDFAETIIDKLPKDFTSKIGIYTGYSKKIELSSVTIDEGKTSNEIIDFGITYY
jgi:hypothetical protein